MSNRNPKHSEEQRAKWREQARQRRERMTPEQRADMSRRQTIYQQRYRAKMTPERYRAYREGQRLYHQRWKAKQQP